MNVLIVLAALSLSATTPPKAPAPAKTPAARAPARAQTPPPADRAQIPERYKWKLGELYPSDAAWADAKAAYAKKLPDFARHRGKLAGSARALGERSGGKGRGGGTGGPRTRSPPHGMAEVRSGSPACWSRRKSQPAAARSARAWPP